MPFIYIHTPFRFLKSKKIKIREDIKRTLKRECREWNLQDSYFHFAFTEELESLDDEERAIMVKAICCEHPYALEKNQVIADLLKQSVQRVFPRKSIRCLFTVLLKETTAFSTTENDHRRY